MFGKVCDKRRILLLIVDGREGIHTINGLPMASLKQLIC